jgi:hypothetical protein
VVNLCRQAAETLTPAGKGVDLQEHATRSAQKAARRGQQRARRMTCPDPRNAHRSAGVAMRWACRNRHGLILAPPRCILVWSQTPSSHESIPLRSWRASRYQGCKVLDRRA